MGGVSGSIDPNFVQSSMVIDYVRVYQNSSLSVDDIVGNNLKIYPNPASNRFNIDSKNKIDRIDIYTLQGHRVLTVKNSENIVDISNLDQGIYFVKIQSQQNVITKRVLKK